jgi:hypothetical protein
MLDCGQRQSPFLPKLRQKTLTASTSVGRAVNSSGLNLSTYGIGQFFPAYLNYAVMLVS